MRVPIATAVPPLSYDRFVRAIHWTTAALLVIVFTIGISMTRWVAEEDKLRVYSWHEWAGLTVFALTALRVWRRTRHAGPPIGLPAGERFARAAVHLAIYAILLAQPIIGWTMTSAFGFDIIYLGLVPLPRLVEQNRELAEQLQEIHEAVAIALFLLILLHLAAIAKHQVIARDGIMRRMTGLRSG
jgi:cytochrome b561